MNSENHIMNSLFQELTIILVLATILAIVFRYLKQPPVLAYILVGIILGPLGLFHIEDHQSFESLAKIGITLLLFLLGLELKISDLRSVGRIAVITGTGQIVFTAAIGFLICLMLGFSVSAALYLAIGLTFSSTIVIVKLLSDKKELTSLHGRISVGFLLVQDFVAILALVILSGLNPESSLSDSIQNISMIIAKTSFLFVAVLYISKEIVPKILKSVAHSQEILFIFSLAWAFGITYIASSPLIGLSQEIGGFLAGLALANSVESFQIVSKVRALRDFFITIFFVTLGMSLSFDNIDQIVLPAILLSIFVLIGNPLIVMLIMKYLGYKKRTGFMAGLAVAQISEFSLIVATLGAQKGHFTASENVIAVLTLVGVVTFAVSSYLFLNSEKIYERIKPYLGYFERQDVFEETNGMDSDKSYSIVLVGSHRMGSHIIHEMEDVKDDLLIVDFDPETIHQLQQSNHNVLFGDITDMDIQEKAHLSEAELIVSTIPSFEDNIVLLQAVKQKAPKAKTVVTTTNSVYVESLYKAGADFVIQPYAFIGKTIGDLLNKDSENIVERLKRKRNY